MLSAELFTFAPGYTVRRPCIASFVSASLHFSHGNHSILGVLSAELFTFAPSYTVRRPCAASFVSATPFFYDADHSILSMLSAELSSPAPGHAVRRVLGTAGRVAFVRHPLINPFLGKSKKINKDREATEIASERRVPGLNSDSRQSGEEPVLHLPRARARLHRIITINSS